MSQPLDPATNDDNRDIERVTQEMASRLLARGIEVYDSDSPDDVVRMMEGLEEFERAVEAAGGDLMMDEPPTNHRGEPDDPHFLLPRRSADESAVAYAQRLAAATSAVRKHKPHT
jgi:hypothetical protein